MTLRSLMEWRYVVVGPRVAVNVYVHGDRRSALRGRLWFTREEFDRIQDMMAGMGVSFLNETDEQEQSE